MTFVAARIRIAVALIALALLLRVLVPAGFMPDRAGGGFAVTICTGMGAVTGWVDDRGTLHRDAPAPVKPTDHPARSPVRASP